MTDQPAQPAQPAPRRRPSPVPFEERGGRHAAPEPTPRAVQQPAQPRATAAPAATAARKRRGLRGLVPVAMLTAAVVLAAAAGVAYVFAPNWFGHGTAERNVGATSGVGTLVNDISPRSIRIPAISAKAPIVNVGEVNRELQIPLNPKIVGWWDGGAKPGARTGTAILAGHINYSGVTGELANIGKLNPGDKVYVTGMRRGKPVTLRFKITGVRTYVKKTLPYQQIFDQKVKGRLAIVTCGGPFDSSTGNYEDNIVAYAVPL